MDNRNIVVKIGSSVLAPGAVFDEKLLDSLCFQLSALIDSGMKVTLVCSGAIALGIEALGLEKRPTNINKLQALAALGQTRLMDEFNEAIAKYGRLCGQILLTRDDFSSRSRYLNAVHTFNELFAVKALPVVNENDTISTEEIQFGDNDTLSALVAGMLEADLLLILSNVDGFMIEGKPVAVVGADDKSLDLNIVKKESVFTKGGMESKLSAIRRAAAMGTKVVLANGRADDVIRRVVLEDEHVGTLFTPGTKVCAKKRWIALASSPKGLVIIDNGAVEALKKKGSSLLSKGVVAVDGDFDRGDTVCVNTQSGDNIACGIAEYSSSYLKRNIGKKLAREVIHRDNLVV